MESAASTMLNKGPDSRKNGVTALFTKHLWKALHLSSPVALSQHHTGSCPDLVMNRNEVLEQKISIREASSRSQSPMKIHQPLCLSISSDGTRQYNGLVSPENLHAQMKQAHSGGAASSTGLLERVSLFCASVSKSTTSKPVESPSKPKSSIQASLLSPLLWKGNFEFNSSPLSVSSSMKSHHGSLKSRAASDPKPREVQTGFSFLEPIIARVTDCIYLGNLCAAYSGQALCKNNIDSIIDMSSLPKDCRLSFIPCTCSRGPQHSWSRLKVHIPGPLEEECLSLQQPCFWDINECLEASLEKRKRVLIHCRDGYSLAPTCVIQYLMVKHHMRLLAAYKFVRARYPVNIRGCHQDLLVGLERSLWPGEVDMECSKQAMSRKMAWT
ncbi:uncharacterized protein LOC133376998 [Rhineura floridana]|uniref:uncharacterized protein LOC133376998 n=1 Tax=Rhineura floridana TaxID=261503 RepID=UPI002AC89012|nr:uncharacterized protein LOC133376998 [Rhineura floridana]XP_061466119.1 uncharacterized protein LOC133376998 [Rhineura floridana]XP_061466120.1 uncharacterized protein LOC133376998 [Rhineura floridana]XP_061466121.1 uncharacterized protein LOC133376998 [Rhineura floridana]XP_061466122.1 uncharacterized protein LOC133376998 [Rhineura floridana]XP_061466123.1 uncharacterized protein LOC133376998 [Rhineura floridana]XP_061466124.1 uncharacterized protein LOC133376998 [Rhineura floridana]XP_0